MPHTNAAAAVVASTLRNKGKAAEHTRRSDALINEYTVNYGSTARNGGRKRGVSGSSSGERLQRVPEDEDTSEGGGSPPSWIMREIEDVEAGRNNDEDGREDELDEEEEETLQEAYVRTKRLYIIVPLSCVVFFAILSSIPFLLWPQSLPQAPSFAELARTMVLAASLWCLTHCLRVPTFNLISYILRYMLSLTGKRRRQSFEWAAIFAPYVHTTVIVILQELLRLSSFYILALQWSLPYGNDDKLYVYDRTFRSLWFFSLGWALAEVCAGIVQGYEQLELYADISSDSSTWGHGLGAFVAMRRPDDVVVPLDGAFEENSLEDIGLLKAASISKRVAEESLQHTIPCVERYPDDPDFKLLNNNDNVDDGDGETRQAFDLDVAITHLTNFKAREDLEVIYGAPFVQIPVFVAILQRVDSTLLSIGMTLTMGFAYLYERSVTATGSLNSNLSHRLPSTTKGTGWASPINKHWHALAPTFIVLTLVHASLGVLHTPGVLSRIRVHVAAYIACLAGLGLVFTGIGMWVDLW